MSNKSKIDKLAAKLDLAKMYFQNDFLDRWNRRTPVRTGVLQAGNEVEVTDTQFEFHNDIPYFPFVENGTPVMAPVGMLKATTFEAPAIWAEAARKAKI